MKDLFDPPNRVVAAFLACPEEMVRCARFDGCIDAESELVGEGDGRSKSRQRMVHCSKPQPAQVICRAKAGPPQSSGCIGL